MKLLTLPALGLLLFSTLGSIHDPDPYDFATAWKEVERLRQEQLPASALAKVEEILAAAGREGKPDQQARAIFFRAELTLEIREDGVEQAIAQYEAALKDMVSPWRQILASQLAGFYLQYFENNRYAIGQRTEIGSAEDADLRSMSSQAFLERIQGLYRQSLEDRPALERPVEDFASVLQPDWNEAGRQRRPTLYLVLAQQYLDYLGRGEMRPTLPTDRYYLTDTAVFAARADFIRHTFPAGDTASFLHRSLLLFQDVLAYPMDTGLPVATYDLTRLQWARDHFQGGDATGLYTRALEDLAARTRETPAFAEVGAALAGQWAASSVFEDLARAESLCKEIIAAWPDDNAANTCRDLLEQLRRPELRVWARGVYTTKEDLHYEVQGRNSPRVQYSLYDLPAETWRDLRVRDGERIPADLEGRQPLRVWEEDFTDSLYIEQTRSYSGESLPIGSYVLVARGEGDVLAWLPFQVSHLSLVTITGPEASGLVVDRRSGAPVPKTKVLLYKEYYDYRSREMKRDLVATRTTDKEGRFRPGRQDEALRPEVILDKDHFISEGSIYTGFREGREGRLQTEWYTDRAIYRPGQEVFFKGLLLEWDKDGQPALRKNQTLELSLRDANYQEQAKITVRTNAYGSFSGSFLLPSGLLTGSFTLQSPHGSKTIRVEEYKRPTFEVAFLPMEKPTALGAEAEVSGTVRGLAGYALGDAQVRYQVYRQLFYPRWCWWVPYPAEKEMVATGSVASDAGGRFRIAFPTRRLDTGTVRGVRYAYTMEVEVTDPAGETRTATHHLSLLDTDFQWRIQAPAEADLSEPLTLMVQALLADETPLAGVGGTLHIIRMEAPRQVRLSEPSEGRGWPGGSRAWAGWTEGETVRQLAFTSGKELSPGRLTPGLYKLRAIATDAGGREVKEEHFLLLTDRVKGQFPNARALYLHADKPEAQPGETVAFSLGLARQDGQVYFQILRGNTVLREGWLKVRRSAELRLTLREEDRGGIVLKAFHIRDNRVDVEELPIAVPWTNKELDIVFETFRDKTLPGAEETYRIRIRPRQGEAQAAEVLMAMYDASLDQFLPHAWRHRFHPSRYSARGFSPLGFGTRLAWGQTGPQDGGPERKYTPVLYPELLSFLLHYGMGIYARDAAVAMSAPPRSGMPPPPPPAENEMAGDMAASRQKNATYLDGQAMDGDGPMEPATPEAEVPPPPRTVLNETVFFLPRIMTEPDGSITVSVTMNEALTRWRMMTLAHTADLQTGYDERFVTTARDLMILPNSPRFIKSGDALWYSARIINTTEQDLPYQATLTLADDLRDTDLSSWIAEEENTEGLIPAGQTIGVRWLLRVPVDASADLLRHTATVRSGQKADAEQGVLPVRSNLVPVIETQTLFLRGGESRDIRFGALERSGDSTRINKLFTVEYTANPVWQAIQALPYIKESADISTVSLINRYAANKLGQDLLRKHPLIEKVFRQWEQEGGAALTSRLEANPELKAMLLEETPWVRQALAESEQRREIAAFFNDRALSNELRQLGRELAGRQSPNGGFVWVPGGRDSEAMTNYILGELGRLRQLGIPYDGDQSLLTRGLQYLDQRVAERYQEIRKRQAKPEEYRPDAYIVSILFTRSMFADIPGGTGEAYLFFRAQALKFRTGLDIYSQALLGQVLYREGHTTWRDIRASLLERSFHAPERGRYFNLGSGYDWHELPVERHAAVMDFLALSGEEGAALDEMKIWLLSHKRVNRWATTKATMAAVHTLLEKGPGKESRPDLEIRGRILVAGKDLGLEAGAQTGTGYLKRHWTGDEIQPALGMLRVENTSGHVAWGGLYYQYLAVGSTVEAHGQGPLKLGKELYRVERGPEGERLVKISEGQPLSIGDELVSRLIIVTDRDMSYIDLKDQRGAGLEPGQVLSGYRWDGGLGYYLSIRDAADHYFIPFLRKGTHVLENRQRVVHRGRYDAGIATIQSSYAPEFSAHSRGFMVEVRP
jgi:hypothetical protein